MPVQGEVAAAAAAESGDRTQERDDRRDIPRRPDQGYFTKTERGQGDDLQGDTDGHRDL